VTCAQVKSEQLGQPVVHLEYDLMVSTLALLASASSTADSDESGDRAAKAMACSEHGLFLSSHQ
jgi:hypothetical protein